MANGQGQMAKMGGAAVGLLGGGAVALKENFDVRDRLRGREMDDLKRQIQTLTDLVKSPKATSAAAQALFVALAAQGGLPLLTAAQISQAGANIAANAADPQTIAFYTRALFSPAAQALIVGAGSVGPLTSAQISAAQAYFQSLMQQAIAPLTQAPAVWVPQNSPALADSALDVAWPMGAYATVSGGYAASPNNVTSGLGSIVPQTGVASAQLFGITANDAQTVRSFCVLITQAGSSNTTGPQAIFNLPAPLKNGAAPKVRLTVDGADQHALEVYVSNRTGGSTPSFAISYAVAASASSTQRWMVEVSE